MLRNRSRSVTSKQALMADHSSQSSPAQNHTKPIPSFFDSPRFKAFTTNGLPENDAIKSPTSILDNKPFFPFGYPFGFNINQRKSPEVFSPNNKQHSPKKLESKGIGLAIIDTFNEKPIENKSSRETSNNKVVLFGTELRVQIPPLPPSLIYPTTPISPTDFGIKSRNSHLSSAFGSPNSGIHIKDSPRVFTGCLPVKEMELSEDYTCVISHGPDPKTTHIFDNCVVESYSSVSDKPKSPPESFLSFCHTCKKNLQQKIDIYIYRGEKAFCSQECRYQEMLLDGVDN
ncbi:protein MARD1-like [Durio zibethinus]|uniref:Protein MARD1-like n=1 Tax=Durio zibethinus TaxID=66656 RepID=A0A6P5XJZ5_DURZI|nr:protein MARD1-like [Durio zibethinus]XP_022728486.1 protein MARD1-like [Durio zibethinus]XP_022728487.1 protein MARD1-like [Durio zibethinus]XP_022728488.1 protein MARD1-like [Durio zibethinus]XP_022728489.1 protein MARD1-like [Durio zibethinus]XP_022728490.1 protein MARD1-like [Durio zibethinus]XP_022728491.1 protein MARD1-like [Durio zibethinus]XP_022728492.1 protein MARD1-like [Durio zibethinus]XP_022728493.1 protein MARD1-like [Durio zibethinus]XP_022728494.1 protein MARD1-like [Dur